MLKLLMNSPSYLTLLAAENGAGDGAPGATGGGDPPAEAEGGAEGDDGEAEGVEGTEDGAEGAEAAGEDAEGQGGGAEGTPPVAAGQATDWRDREIGRKHRKLQDAERRAADAERRAADAEALLQRQSSAVGEGDPPARAQSAVLTEADVDRRANAKLAQQNYAEACNTTFAKGATEYKDKWEPALEQLSRLGGLGEDAQGVEVMQSILATDDPAKVLYTLGNDPDTYHRVMDLPPARRLAEIVKLGIPEPKKIKKPSDTPVPPSSITRRAETNNDTAKLYDDKTSDEDWYAIRLAQKERKFAARQGKSGRAA